MSISFRRTPARDLISSEHDAVVSERDQLRARFFETAHGTLPALTFVSTPAPTEISDDSLVERVVTAYRRSVATMGSPSKSSWERTFFNLKRDVHHALLAESHANVQRLLRDPGKTNLFHGFEGLARSQPSSPEWTAVNGMTVYQEMLLLAEAIGVRRLWSPETPALVAPLPPIDDLLLKLDGALGFTVDFPNPFAGEIGLKTARGVISRRAVQALYQAWRVFKLVNYNRAARILEIGAGLGRTAYFAKQFGLSDYTIVDLPLTGVAQAYFLGRVLGDDAICLFDEIRPGIRVLPPCGFLDTADSYDLVLNVDSLTEMTANTARSYVNAIQRRTGLFFSINHEANPFTVAEITASAGMRAPSRAPCWLRPGYVEELFHMGDLPTWSIIGHSIGPDGEASRLNDDKTARPGRAIGASRRRVQVIQILRRALFRALGYLAVSRRLIHRAVRRRI